MPGVGESIEKYGRSRRSTRPWAARCAGRPDPLRVDDAREVAELLGVPVSTVHEWGRKGTLPRVKLGRHVRFIRSHVGAAILGAATYGR